MLGGAVGSAATVYVQRTELEQKRDGRTQELRTQAYRKFLEKADAAMGLADPFSRCVTTHPLSEQVKTTAIECQNEAKRLLDGVVSASGSSGDIVIYGSEQADAQSKHMLRSFVTPQFEFTEGNWVYFGPVYSKFLSADYSNYLDQRQQFLLVMCRDLTPLPRQSCR